MGLVYSQSQSGLVVAEHGGDEAAVARALREYDRDLRLLPPGVDLHGTDRRHYRVVAYRGGDRPPLQVCTWEHPLSMRLLDKVKELDRNTRSTYLSEDDRNARHREQLAKRTADEAEALISEYLIREKRTSPVHRSVGLRIARDKARGRGENV